MAGSECGAEGTVGMSGSASIFLPSGSVLLVEDVIDDSFIPVPAGTSCVRRSVEPSASTAGSISDDSALENCLIGFCNALRRLHYISIVGSPNDRYYCDYCLIFRPIGVVARAAITVLY